MKKEYIVIVIITAIMTSILTTFAQDLITQFPDVDKNAYYASSVDAMLQLGVINGYENGNFGPNDSVTRAQLVTMLDRYKNETTKITRKAELELEGLINDYFFRRQIKDPILFGDFNAYGSVIAKSIVVYVYLKNDLSQVRTEEISDMIKKDLHEQLLDFPGFEWAKEYTLNVVVR